jgi:hypothetical protein
MDDEEFGVKVVKEREGGVQVVGVPQCAMKRLVVFPVQPGGI